MAQNTRAARSAVFVFYFCVSLYEYRCFAPREEKKANNSVLWFLFKSRSAPAKSTKCSLNNFFKQFARDDDFVYFPMFSSVHSIVLHHRTRLPKKYWQGNRHRNHFRAIQQQSINEFGLRGGYSNGVLIDEPVLISPMNDLNGGFMVNFIAITIHAYMLVWGRIINTRQCNPQPTTRTSTLSLRNSVQIYEMPVALALLYFHFPVALQTGHNS